MGYGFEGSRLEMTKGMSRAEIAKLYRQDVKDAIKRGDLPKGLKVSVRTQEYAGGGSINVRVTAVPAGFRVLNPSRVYAQLCSPHVYNERPYRSVEAAALLKKLDAMLQAYNFDDSDTQTDYFHVRFYGHSEIDSEVTAAENAALKVVFEAGQMEDPGEMDLLEYREQVEKLSELRVDPANEVALRAQVAAKALGAGSVPRAPKPTPTHVCAAGLCTKGISGDAEYCEAHKHMEGLEDFHGVNIPRVPGLVNTIGPSGLPTRVLAPEGCILGDRCEGCNRCGVAVGGQLRKWSDEEPGEYEAQLIAAGFI